LIKNEKLILTLLYRKGPLSKRDIAKYGCIGWATTVKLVNRLKDKDLVECKGISLNNKKKGKNPYLYDIKKSKPLVIGIDIEYNTTTIILTNLECEILKKDSYKTPKNPDSKILYNFLYKIVSNFIKKYINQKEELLGIGIGIPGIDFPIGTKNDRKYISIITKNLEKKIGVKILFEVNTRAYALFMKWRKKQFFPDDFVFLSIRTGVGTGIFINGKLYTGYQNLAGEVGHIGVIKKGELCRCGKRGCLETVLNQYILNQEYCKIFSKKTLKKKNNSTKKIYENLSNLFIFASENNKEAIKIINNAAKYLAIVLSNILMILNTPLIIISGNFGPAGDFIIPILKKFIRKKILSDIDFKILYLPFDEDGHTLGSAMLILRDFFI